jgi:hypothetical protein
MELKRDERAQRRYSESLNRAFATVRAPRKESGGLSGSLTEEAKKGQEF